MYADFKKRVVEEFETVDEVIGILFSNYDNTFYIVHNHVDNNTTKENKEDFKLLMCLLERVKYEAGLRDENCRFITADSVDKTWEDHGFKILYNKIPTFGTILEFGDEKIASGPSYMKIYGLETIEEIALGSGMSSVHPLCYSNKIETYELI